MTKPPPTLAELVTQLAAAVRAGDRARAFALAGQIQQRLASEEADHASLERQVRALLAELAAPQPRPALLKLEALADVRGLRSTAPEEGMVFPAWFGTNRKPTPEQRC